MLSSQNTDTILYGASVVNVPLMVEMSIPELLEMKKTMNLLTKRCKMTKENNELKCPECGFRTCPARVLKKQGKSLVHTGYVIACKHIDCDWQSEEMPLTRNGAK